MSSDTVDFVFGCVVVIVITHHVLVPHLAEVLFQLGSSAMFPLFPLCAM
jgi:hypothetical protein